MTDLRAFARVPGPGGAGGRKSHPADPLGPRTTPTAGDASTRRPTRFQLTPSAYDDEHLELVFESPRTPPRALRSTSRAAGSPPWSGGRLGARPTNFCGSTPRRATASACRSPLLRRKGALSRSRAPAPHRLRRLRHLLRDRFLGPGHHPRRSGLVVGGRPCARRVGEGARLVRGGAAARQDS